jgi:AcrR family transcriptional regulator
VGRPRGDTRERILAAAFETLRTRGYAGTSTRSVAATGGFNPALIFYYFGGLDDLLVAALAASSESRLARYREAVAAAASLEELLGLLRSIYEEDVSSGHIRVVTEMVAASVANDALAPRVVELMEPWLELAEEGVRKATEGLPLEGVVSPRELALAAVTFYLGANLMTRLVEERAEIASMLESARRVAPVLDALLRGAAP